MARNGVVPSRRWKSKSESEIDFCPSESQSAAHVLAVDDSLIDRKVIERLLRTSSCKVTAVDSGMRALEFLEIAPKNSEMKSPLLKQESSTFKETPVVIMSSENVMARIDRCLEEGAEDFILKPVKLSDVKRLRDYMSREDRSKGRESGMNKRKQRDGSDLSSQSPPSSRSSPSDSSMSPESQSLPSVSSSPSLLSASHSLASPSPSSSTPSSPSPASDLPMTPPSPSGPLDSPMPPSPYGPSDSLVPSSPIRRLKMTNPDEIERTP
ncbi:hypothetical protein Cgig2_031216 [Carnegiea gigantea]|uniref:Response regulatory domain-containing protein n=1 Tax=Carnegiea gigantea TaxID=171969 RepID=A0A9Q1KL55_9CARY|nr:hypothetical protein Cgig2_031216 [Carnegiea gigantea]